MRQLQSIAMTLAASSLLGACATKGFVRRGLDEQRAALQAEGTTRARADSALDGRVTALRTGVDSLRTDLNALRADLTTLRNDFGARITAMEGQVTFAMPVHFDFDASSVRAQDEAALAKFAQVAKQYYAGATITVEGFADPAGSAAYNVRLSRARAEAVKGFLVGKGLSDADLRTVGYGKSRLVRPGASGDATGAELNRRVTFVVETPAGATATVAAIGGGH
ncbi:MAG: OmpA family protein [Gemmatimonadetes bacterium]|nr:OmpA family protein [Gemmatimonadota bacterium]